MSEREREISHPQCAGEHVAEHTCGLRIGCLFRFEGRGIGFKRLAKRDEGLRVKPPGIRTLCRVRSWKRCTGSHALHSIQGFGIRISGFGFWDSGFGTRVSGSGFGIRVSGFGFQVSGFRMKVAGCGVRVQGPGFRVQGLKITQILVRGSGFRI